MKYGAEKPKSVQQIGYCEMKHLFTLECEICFIYYENFPFLGQIYQQNAHDDVSVDANTIVLVETMGVTTSTGSWAPSELNAVGTT